MNTEAWRAAFDERHQFDVYPDHFMSGLRNEFCAGWHAALKSQVASQAALKVWYGPMPESNGKTNWTAILHKGDIASGMVIDRSEYPDRVRYEADRARWLIGELDKEPFILDYDADKHSGYKAPASQLKPLTDRAKDALDSVIHFYSLNGAEDVAEEIRALLEASK